MGPSKSLHSIHPSTLYQPLVCFLVLSMSYPNRWSNNDPRQGSAFHELVVLPTLAPQLARPYVVPGSAADPPSSAGQPEGTGVKLISHSFYTTDRLKVAPAPDGNGSQAPLPSAAASQQHGTEIVSMTPPPLIRSFQFFATLT